jgi:Resolvase, N terminal domain/Recombinase
MKTLSVMYGRISADESENDTSLDRQKELCVKYAESKELHISEFFTQDIVNPVSGEIYDRDGLNALYDYLKSNPQIKNVIIPFVSRLGRGYAGFSVPFEMICKGYNAVIHFAAQNDTIDRNSPGYKIQYLMGNAVAEKQEILRRTQDGAKKLVGKKLLAKAPDGYTYVRDEQTGKLLGKDTEGYYLGLKVDIKRETVIKTLFEEYLIPGNSSKDVTNKLNSLNLLTPTGKKWTRQGVIQILKKPWIYAGYYYAMRTTYEQIPGEFTKKVIRHLKKEDFQKEENLLRLGYSYITMEQSEEIEMKLLKISGGGRKPKIRTENQSILRKFIFCSKCGKPSYPVRSVWKLADGTPVRKYQYFCGTKIRKNLNQELCEGFGSVQTDLLDTEVLNRLILYFDSVSKGVYPTQNKEQGKNQQTTLERRVEEITALQKGLETKEEEILEYLISKILTPEKYQKAQEILETERKNLSSEKSRIEKELLSFREEKKQSEYIVNHSMEILDILSNQKEGFLLQRLFEQINLRVFVYSRKSDKSRDIRIEVSTITI